MAVKINSETTLGLVITDGVGFRNFILSDFLNQATSTFDKVVIFSALPAKTYKNRIPSEIIIEELSDYEEHGATWFFRKAKEIAHLKNNQKENFGIQDNLLINYSQSPTRRGKLTRFIYTVTQRFNSERWIGHFYALQQKSISKGNAVKNYRSLLKVHKPQVLFFTHQRPPYVAPIILAAEKEKISTISFIFSWDNLASKGRMAGDFGHYLVWSNLMRKELLQFYGLVNSKNISVVGTPQFEPYILDSYRSDKNEFHTRFGLDSSLQTICFSCGDVSTSPNDPHYIEVIAKAMLSSQIEPVNFIVRTSPAEDPQRFAFLKKEYPFIIWNYPDWPLVRKDHVESWSQRVPEKSDLKDLRMILEFSDLGINMCSTMSLDFMIFDKPVINPVFGNEKNNLYNDQKYLRYAHYERVVKSGAVSIAQNKEELIDSINFSLKNPRARLTAQRSLLKLQIGRPLKGTSLRIAEALKELL